MTTARTQSSRSAVSMSWRQDKWKWGRDKYPYTSILFDRCPAGEPRGFWAHLGGLRVTVRATGLAALALSVAMLVEIISKFGWGSRRISGSIILPFSVVIIVHSLVVAFGFRFARGRFKRDLIRNDWRICMACGYNLQGLPDHHSCPECGTEYDVDALTRDWQAWLERHVVYGDKI